MSKDKELAVNGKPIHSNKKLLCARCKQPIVEANDSGWEVFIEGNLTQPICVFCDVDDHVNRKKEG
ncbi:MAG TPA: hypothetical protein VMX17_15770 [Candidatus Glassbacteria bacterium]|nr:hypothetical protein [Candidatus Glassbacteria bacterium]